ncbi:hypothetical protein WMY93_021982 [Mugilogobius chulae]|uniref:Uncharacterized protein n=1 Tax=Mugilogobius chulae TaxID=88201 RepID=A0AAW0NMR0_9GOBI
MHIVHACHLHVSLLRVHFVSFLPATDRRAGAFFSQSTESIQYVKPAEPRVCPACQRSSHGTGPYRQEQCSSSLLYVSVLNRIGPSPTFPDLIYGPALKLSCDLNHDLTGTDSSTADDAGILLHAAPLRPSPPPKVTTSRNDSALRGEMLYERLYSRI